MNCAVCSNPAKGLNYTVLTCYGCRSFFGRSYKLKFPKCNFDEKCYDTKGLKKCKTCRMKKCLHVGMVMKTRKPSLEVNMKKDKTWNFTEILEALSHLDSKVLKLRESSYNPISFPDIEEMINSPIMFNLADKHGPMQGWPMNVEEFCQKQRTLKTTIFMHEVRNEKVLSLDDPSINTKCWMLFDWASSADYVKTFDFFQQLSHVDKKKLIRASVVAVTNLTFYFTSYRAKKSVVQVPEGICFDESNIGVFLEYLLGLEIDEKYFKKFHEHGKTTLMDPLIRYNVTYQEYLFIKALLVCNPALPLSQKGQTILANERQKFGAALLNYCLSEHGRVNGPSRFVTVLNYVNCIIQHEGQCRQMIIYLRSISPNRLIESRKRIVDQILFN